MKTSTIVAVAVLAPALSCLSAGAAPDPAKPTPARKLVDDFEAMPVEVGLPPGWQREFFKDPKPPTRFEVVNEKGNGVLRASSENSASLLVKPICVDLKEYPVLTWRWKIRAALKRGDAHSRFRDDYAARVFVMFLYDPSRVNWFKRCYFERLRRKHGVYPPGSGITFIWANRLPQGEIVANAYARRAVAMVAVQTGDRNAGKWVRERCNVLAIYRRFFECDPPPVIAVALSSDSDNTHESTEAWFDEIAFEADFENPAGSAADKKHNPKVSEKGKTEQGTTSVSIKTAPTPTPLAQ